jgi:hypothetical protein
MASTSLNNEEKYVGIITATNSLFSSGLVQNAFFIYDVLERCGHKCQLLAYKPDSELGFRDISIKEITTDHTRFDYENYKMIITVGRGVTKEMYDVCKSKDIRVIGFICGNSLLMHLEAFVGTSPVQSLVTKSQPIDKLWIIEAFSFMAPYLRILRDAPTKLVPHLWSPSLIENAARKKLGTLEGLPYKPKLGQKYTIVVLEPNINIVKTALIPAMAAEKAYLDNPDSIDEVFIFNFPEKNPNAWAIIDSLSVRKKIRIFKSLHIVDILSFFNSKDSMPIFVSHQLYTPWNYLYYELMNYGYPLVHNSVYFKDYCYFYDDMNIDKCVDKINEAYRAHNGLYKTQMEFNKLFLKTIDPENAACQKIWADLVDDS